MPPKTRIDTSLATVLSDGIDPVEIRIKPGVTITRQAIYDLIDGIDTHGLTAPDRLLVVIPKEGVHFHTTILKQDHFSDRPKGVQGRRMAWVIPSSVDRHLARVYMSYFPPPFDTKLFASESEAIAWLGASL